MKLKNLYSKKLIFSVLIPLPQFTIRFNDLVVYSWLVSRRRKKKGLRRARISKRLGLSRGHTLPAIINRLKLMGLVHEQERVLFASSAPPKDKFNYAKFGYPSYWHILIPTSKPLTLKQSAIWSKLHDKQGTRQLSRLLRFDKATIIRAVRKFRELGVLDINGMPVQPTPDIMSWFMDKSTKEEPKNQVSKPEKKPLPKDWSAWSEYWKSLSDMLFDSFPADWQANLRICAARAQQEHYDYGRMCDAWKKAFAILDPDKNGANMKDIGDLVLATPELIMEAADKNRQEGDGFGLFVCKMNDWCKKRIQEKEREARYYGL
jgi:hypothetical protein